MKKYIHRLRRWMCFLRQTAHNLVTNFFRWLIVKHWASGFQHTKIR